MEVRNHDHASTEQWKKHPTFRSDNLVRLLSNVQFAFFNAESIFSNGPCNRHDKTSRHKSGHSRSGTHASVHTSDKTTSQLVDACCARVTPQHELISPRAQSALFEGGLLGLERGERIRVKRCSSNSWHFGLCGPQKGRVFYTKLHIISCRVFWFRSQTKDKPTCLSQADAGNDHAPLLSHACSRIRIGIATTACDSRPPSVS